MPTFRTAVPYRGGFTHPLSELRDEFDRLWTTLTTAPLSQAEGGLARQGWGLRPGAGGFPAVNVAETDDRLTVEAELPGLDAGDVEVSVMGDELLLKGSRPGTSPESAAGSPEGTGTRAAGAGNGEERRGVVWHRRERGTGGFERRIPLPVPVDAARVEARLVDGVLTVTCPKSPEAQPRRIEVRST